MKASDFQAEWVPSDKDSKLTELAQRYHAETEAYDRTVCTGPIVNDSIMPVTPHEFGLINSNAIAVLKRITDEARTFGIDARELRRAIGRHA